MDISISRAKCTKCGRCVKVCPSKIFGRQTAASDIEVVAPETCIVCGHCVAACPESAVTHAAFPPQKVHEIDYGRLPDPESLMLLMKSRRSNRAFSDRPVPAANLETILEAAHRAPTGSNVQNVGFTVVTDPGVLKKISDITMGTFAKTLGTLKNPLLKPFLKKIMPDAVRYIPVFERLRREHLKGNDLILRGATAVIFIHAPRSSRMGHLDANLAYQNGSLMAEALGVSQFYTGFVLNAARQDKKGNLEKMLGIDGTIHAGMALGLPQFRFPNYIDRKPISVTEI